MTTIKAVRDTVLLGNIELNVYQMPDSSYRLAGRNVTDAVDEPNNSLIRKLGVKSLKALPGADLSLIQVQSETGESFVPVSLSDAARYWRIMDKEGNAKAGAIVEACLVENLERRADAVFGVKRTEEERNQRLAVRIESKEEFKALTATLKQSGFTEWKEYQKYIGIFQKALGIKAGTRDELDSLTLIKLTIAQQSLAEVIDMGVEPWAALFSFVKRQQAKA